MKKAVIAVFTLAACTTAAEAKPAIWQGDAFIVTASGTCSVYNPAGNHYRVRYFPANLGDNGPESSFAWYGQDYTLGYFLAGFAFSSTPRKVVFRSIYSGGADRPSDPVTVAFVTQVPPAPTATTKFISIQGTITNYDFMTGCNVNFRMALGLTTN